MDDQRQLTQTFKVKTQPTQEPIQPSDLLSQFNADVIDDGGKFTRVATAARELFEGHSGVSLMPTVWQCFLDRFPDCGEIKLKRGPATAIASVIYDNVDGDSTTLSTGLYQTDVKRTPARIRPVSGQAWPVVEFNKMNAVTIEFTAGFASIDLVPKKAIQAILMLAGYWLENPTMMGQVGADMSLAYWSLVDAVHWEVFDE